jgi:putative ABC transport system permease protein
VAFKSVEPGYPLRGNLKVAAAPGGASANTRDIPAPGEVWVDAPLLDALGLRMGDTAAAGRCDACSMARILVIKSPTGAQVS